MSKLFLMMGAPGSGKSYWAEHHLKITDKYISRDEIRFSFLSDGDEYFSKENEVFNEFIRQINASLTFYDRVFADATHLNYNSRMKTLNRITVPVEEVNVIFLDTPLQTCLERNSKRTGRKLVPNQVVRNMFNSIAEPTELEGISKLYRIREDEPIQIIEIKRR